VGDTGIVRGKVCNIWVKYRMLCWWLFQGAVVDELDNFVVLKMSSKSMCIDEGESNSELKGFFKQESVCCCV
jgi:hypothetical protein